MCHGEHIHGLNRHRVIACGGEYFAVAGKRCGVAGDICDALGSAVYNCIKSGLFRSAARRIKQNCREAFAFRNEAGQGCFGILADEFRVFDVVEFCIPTGILNGGRNRFNAQNGAGVEPKARKSCLSRKKHPQHHRLQSGSMHLRRQGTAFASVRGSPAKSCAHRR